LKSAEKENFLLINSVLLLSEREWGEKWLT
jgi:hypothetical protein